MTSGLRFVFGSAIDGDAWDEAVRQCPWSFVRSRDQLALDYPKGRATGHKMTAWEAWAAYGRDVIDEAIENGGAVLRKAQATPETYLLNRCERLGIPWPTVAGMSGLSHEEAALGADSTLRIHIKSLGAAAFGLGLDERMLSYREDCGADSELTDRLSALQPQLGGNTSPSAELTTAALAEGVSVMRVQGMLEAWLGKVSGATMFRTSGVYGVNAAAARQSGYRLAKDVRETLGLGVEPIASMKDLVEEQLGIPIVPAELPDEVAGATVSSVDHTGKEFRGVFVNSVGLNEDVWVSRVTLARELGHALFDSRDRIGHIQVDHHLVGDGEDTVGRDVIKQRADAFALAFLAPMEEVKRIAPLPVDSNRVGLVMRKFGMCEAAARRRIESCYSGEVQNVPMAPDGAKPEAQDIEAELTVRGGNVLFPIKESRRGKFAETVMDCFRGNLISDDTAGLYLGCSPEEVAGGVTMTEPWA